MSAFIAILMLDTAFPRIIGDVGNPESYPMPVRTYVVTGADVPDVVRAAPPPSALVDAFIATARRAQADGAVGIVTSCGFLGHAQAALAASVDIPVIASALSLGPLIRSMHSGRIGIITADATALTTDLLKSAGLAPADVAIAGLQDSPAWRALILGSKTEQATQIDIPAISTLVEDAGYHLTRDFPDIAAILLECGNLPPYTRHLSLVTDLPVYHILHAADFLWAAYPARRNAPHP